MMRIYTLAILLLISHSVFAQPSNDECIDAIPLADVANWCSVSDAYTTVNATESADPSPQCFPNNTTSFDVWFSFVAQAPNVEINVSGNTGVVDGGTLNVPQVALYSGECGNLAVEACNSDNSNDNFASFIEPGLEIGETYYIRVSARFDQTGTFRLCVNNFNAIPPPDGDCPTAVLLCDRSTFSVPSVSGVGVIPNEIGDVSCNDITCPFDESSSTWYRWVCDEEGPLAFTLTPNNPDDDIDFVLYELPNGIDDCSGRFDLRCMASGETVGAPIADWAPCTGPTGLSLADPDISEACGCQPGDNNFASAVNMQAGRAYALVINNFTQSGGGFTIEFDQSPGTGTFLGPTADFDFDPDVACVGETVTFTDASSFIGNIDSYTWNFGTDATPRSATGIGPHDVVYSTPGLKTVLLEITSERGCIVTQIELATEVICCDDHFESSSVVTDVDCPDSTDGAIDFSVTSDFGPFGYAWNTGATTQDINNLEPGVYVVTVVDEASCEEEFLFVVESPPPITLDTLIVMPTCDGGTDGSVTIVVEGGTPPYEYNWQNTGFGPDNFLMNIAQGDYTVTIRDANDCLFTQVIPVRELQLELDPMVQTIVPPSCFGFSDGSITIAIINGLPPYQYNFNDGNGFVASNTLQNIPAGVYEVNVLDANLCQGNFTLNVEDFPPLVLDIAVDNVSCFGLSDASLTTLVTGGFGSYTYNWSNGSTEANQINSLPAGNYSLTVTDGNDCVIIDQVEVTQPDSLGLGVVDIVDNICFGESAGAITVEAVGGSPPYEYSTDGFTFQSDPTLGGLPAGDYTLTVLDAEGCTATTEATVSEPLEVLVDAGPDRFIILGFDTLVQAVSNYTSITFDWSPTDSLECLSPNCSTVNVFPTSTTTYQVQVTNENGCTAVDDVTIFVIKDRPYYIPNIFSPNLDGRNDGFTVFGGPALEQVQKLQIFSRWGSLVFETNNIFPNDESLGWDGTFKGQPVNPGVFVYQAELRFTDQEVIQVEGDVTVLR